ncbi:MAG: GUN4 domain-containing protein [Elainella sp. Prado103]|jgi:hypothetical protein|nr:GUN4 domain-containing protein [Elainella sp. Prado103]
MSTADAKSSYRAYIKRFVTGDQPTEDEQEAMGRYWAYLRLTPEQAAAIEQEIFGDRGASSAGRCSGVLGLDPDPKVSSTNGASLPASQPDLTAQPVDAVDASTQPRVQEGQGERAAMEQSVTRPSDLSGIERVVRQSSTTPETLQDTTILLPQSMEEYFQHLQEYQEAFRQALQTEGFTLSEETTEMLRKLAKKHDLVGTDVAAIEREMLVKMYLITAPPAEAKPDEEPIVEVEPPVVVPMTYDSQLNPNFKRLRDSLDSNDLKLADAVTFEILKQVINPVQDELDEESLKRWRPNVPEQLAIQEIDQLWRQKSPKFGFNQQLLLYGPAHIVPQEADLDRLQRENRSYALAFSKKVQWWIKGLEFYKFYNQLDFSLNAPPGHLPAFWFWQTSRSQSFQYGGLGLFNERGGSGIDAFIIPSFMYMLSNSNLNP